MSENINPYQAPGADLNAPKPTVSSNGLTETMVKYLKEAAPWIRFLGILGFIGSGFTALAGLGIMIAFPFIARLSGEFYPAALMGSSMGIIYIILGAVIFFPARFTYNFGAKIRSYLQSNSELDLELAFKNNKSFWKFNGILCIVYLAFIPVAIVIGVISVIVSGIF